MRMTKIRKNRQQPRGTTMRSIFPRETPGCRARAVLRFEDPLEGKSSVRAPRHLRKRKKIPLSEQSMNATLLIDIMRMMRNRGLITIKVMKTLIKKHGKIEVSGPHSQVQLFLFRSLSRIPPKSASVKPQTTILGSKAWQDTALV